MSEVAFSYLSISTEQAGELRAAAERIRLRLSRSAEDIVAIGKELMAVKAGLDEGDFKGWVKSEFEMSRAAAYRWPLLSVSEMVSQR